MKFFLPILLVFWFIIPYKILFAQITLGTTSYVQNFNEIQSGLSTEFTVRTAATALSITATLTTAATAWNDTTDMFKNFASADGSTSTEATALQAASIDRFLGLQQTETLVNHNSAYIMKLANRWTLAKGLFKRKNLPLNNALPVSLKQSTVIADFASKKNNLLIGKTEQEAQSTTLTFAAQNINTTSAAQSFTIRGSKLSADVTVRTNAPFSISKDNIVYEPLLIYSIEELASNQTIYVKFNPTATGNYTSSVTNVSEGADNKFVNLSGTAVAANTMVYGNRLDANNIISPNGDGINDIWIIKNIENYPNNTVKLMDKAGKVIYSKQGYTNDWNGTYNNAPLAQGTYYYIVDFGADSGLFFRGFITIVRD